MTSPRAKKPLAVVHLACGGSMHLAWANGRLELQVFRSWDGQLDWASAVTAEQLPALVAAMHAASAEANWQAARRSRE